MTHPFKKVGYSHGIYEQVATLKNEMLGEYRQTRDGRGWRYGMASETLTPGKMTHETQLNAAHLNEAILAVVAIGEYTLDLTITNGKAMEEDELRGGYFQIMHGTGQGQNLLISGNTLLAVGGTAIQIALDDPIKIALDDTSEYSLVRSPWFDVAFSTDSENFATGVPPIGFTADYYGWFQTRGVCNCLIMDTPLEGSNLILGTDEGALAVIDTSIDPGVPIVGTMWGAQGVDGEYCPVFLQID